MIFAPVLLSGSLKHLFSKSTCSQQRVKISERRQPVRISRRIAAIASGARSAQLCGPVRAGTTGVLARWQADPRPGFLAAALARRPVAAVRAGHRRCSRLWVSPGMGGVSCTVGYRPGRDAPGTRLVMRQQRLDRGPGFVAQPNSVSHHTPPSSVQRRLNHESRSTSIA